MRAGWVVLLALTSAARAGWEDRTLGEPLVETFGRTSIGRSLDAWSLATEAGSSALWVGTQSTLLRFDGAAWETIPLPDGLYVRSIHAESSDLVWFGTSATLGYARRTEGRWQAHSLDDAWPDGTSPPKDVFGTFKTGRFVDFVTRDRVARWDGRKFRLWEFPTTPRLFPVVFENALWFHHRETGLYELTEDGPQLRFGPETLPDRGVMGLVRDQRGLVSISNRGLRRVAPGLEARHDDKAGEFMETNVVSAVATLPDGHLAIGTVHGGIGILSPGGELLRQIDASAGLAGNASYAVLLDREGSLWHAARAGLTRFSARPAVTRIRFPERAQVRHNMLVLHEGEVWSASDSGLFAFDPASGGRNARIASQAHYLSIARYRDGLLLGRHGAVDFRRGDETRTFTEQVGEGYLGLLPSRFEDAVYAAEVFRLVRLVRHGEKVEREVATNLPATAGTMAEDGERRVWLGLQRNGLHRFDPARGILEDLTPESLRGLADRSLSHVIPMGARLHALIGDRLLSVEANGTVRESPVRLPGKAVLARASRDGRRLYVVFERDDVPQWPEGLAVVEFDARGAAGQVRDLQVTGLPFAGLVSALEVGRDGEHEILWIGGNEGLLRLRPDELEEWKPSRPPLLQVIASRAEDDNGRPEFHFASHHIAVTVKPVENALQPTLRFQTHLGRDGTISWSAPTTRAVFEFSNLVEGHYTFAARTLNAAGQPSEPAFYSFRVLPPWYRSRAAYAAYAIAAGLGLAGLLHYRERRTRHLEKLVRERTEQLEKASAAKDEFLASMSHEIRNPMNGVVGLSAAIDISPLNEEAQRRFAMLRHCAEHLSTLLEDILDFSRLQTGRVELNLQPFSPAELLASVSAITTPDSVAAGIPVEVALSPTVPPSLTGDVRRIRQILLNFVSNALKYAGRGKIEITVWARAGGDGRHALTFAVSDEGPGIAPAEQERIFEKFERGTTARTTRIPGTGMGLAVCRLLAERMGGRVWVESQRGQGSTFYLRLPLAEAGAAAAGPGARALPPVLKWALVVDDEEYNCIALSAMLEQLGFRVHMERDPLQALALAEHQPFDLVFLDYDMPGLTGPALARRLREQQARHGDQPILLATTAYTTEEKRAECLAAGMDGFLGKPVTADRIALALQQALRTRTPAGVHYPPEQFPPAGRWDNLQRVADKRGTDLTTETGQFVRSCGSELESLLRAIDAENAREAGAAAHRLAGRFAFIHGRTASHLATKLEQCAQRYEWRQARELHSELARHWEQLRAELTSHPSAPAG